MLRIIYIDNAPHLRLELKADVLGRLVKYYKRL